MVHFEKSGYLKKKEETVPLPDGQYNLRTMAKGRSAPQKPKLSEVQQGEESGGPTRGSYPRKSAMKKKKKKKGLWEKRAQLTDT